MIGEIGVSVDDVPYGRFTGEAESRSHGLTSSAAPLLRRELALAISSRRLSLLAITLRPLGRTALRFRQNNAAQCARCPREFLRSNLLSSAMRTQNGRRRVSRGRRSLFVWATKKAVKEMRPRLEFSLDFGGASNTRPRELEPGCPFPPQLGVCTGEC